MGVIYTAPCSFYISHYWPPDGNEKVNVDHFIVWCEMSNEHGNEQPAGRGLGAVHTCALLTLSFPFFLQQQQ